MLFSRIIENIPYQFVSIQHYGLLIADKEIIDGPEVEKWANGHENYSYQESMESLLLLLTWILRKIF